MNWVLYYVNLPFSYPSLVPWFWIFPLDHGLHDIFFLFLSFCCLQRLLGGFDRCGGAIAWWYWRCVPHQHLSATISTYHWLLIYDFEPGCKMHFSFPVLIAVAFWTCLSGCTRFTAECAMYAGCWVSTVSVLKKMSLITRICVLLFQLYWFTLKMGVVKDFLISFTSPFMGSLLVSVFLLISFWKYGCTLTVLLI